MSFRPVTVALVALLAAATLRSQSPSGSAAPATALLTGHVIDAETQAPVPATIITLTPNGKPEYQAGVRVITDGQGRFFFSDVAPGRYTLTTAKPGWLTGAYARHRPAGEGSPIDLHDGEHANDVTLALWRTAVSSGHVTDEHGEALVGTDVRVFQRSYAAGHAQWTFVTRALTDDRGIYRLSALQPGDYLVVVPATVTSEPVAMGVQSQTPRTFFQTMTAIGAAPMSFDRATITTNGTDTAVSSILPPVHAPPAAGAWMTYATTFYPSATAIGGASIVQAVSGRERQGIDIVVRLVSTWQVSGTVTATDGSPTGFHAVHLLPADSADRPVVDAGTAVTDVGGRFTFYGIPPGQYVARVVRIPLRPGADISTCGGTGQISFVCAFEQPGRPGGTDAAPAPSLMYADAPVTVANRDASGIQLQMKPGARVGGRTQFEGTAAALTDAEWNAMHVVMEPAGGQSFAGQGGFDVTQPGVFLPDGKFTTASLWPGRYVLRVTGAPSRWIVKTATVAGRDIADGPLDLSSDLSDVLITFTDRTLTITGGVTSDDGRAGEATLVLLFPASPADWVDYGRTSRRVQSAAAVGRAYSLPIPPPGEYRLVALPDEQAVDWQNPAFLMRAAAAADRITIRDGESITHDLRARSLP